MIIKYTYSNYFQFVRVGQMDLSSGPAFLGTVMLYLLSVIGKDQMLSVVDTGQSSTDFS